MTDSDEGYTISGDAENYYVSDRRGRIMSTHDTADEARDALDGLLRQDQCGGVIEAPKCNTCRGSGRAGPDVKKESPVAPGGRDVI